MAEIPKYWRIPEDPDTGLIRATSDSRLVIDDDAILKRLDDLEAKIEKCRGMLFAIANKLEGASVIQCTR